MKHLIMGTAGHVDHGKTSLIKALTGIDCDTHKEEKRRGITINLGFSFLNLSEEESVGIIDVPGHKDFINTMVGGACGIDFVMLVIAADSGIMPQTVEHLNIINSLGVTKGIVALTKADLVDEELVELAKMEIQEFLAGGSLKDAPVVAVSSVTGAGLEDLKGGIRKLIAGIEERESSGAFRMYIDRIFSVKGFGSVVTGSVMSGTLKADKEVYLLPGDYPALRVRSLERHGKPVDKVVGGDRAAINLIGLDLEDFKRGMILSDQQLKSTTMIDATVTLFDKEVKLKLWSHVTFHTGTFECPARMHAISKERIQAGEPVVVQIHLERPAVLVNKDRFIIRNSSGDRSLGGGFVMDIAPLHHKKRTESLIQNLGSLSETLQKGDSLAGMIKLELKKALRPFTLEEVAEKLHLGAGEIIAGLESGASGVEVLRSEEGTFLLDKAFSDNWADQLCSMLAAYHKENPVFPDGYDVNEIAGKLGLSKSKQDKAFLLMYLEELCKKGLIEKYKSTWILKGHQASMDQNAKEGIEWLEQVILEYDTQKTVMSEIEEKAVIKKISKHDLKMYLSWLVKNGKVVFFQNEFVHTALVKKYRPVLLELLVGQDKGIEINTFKDKMNASKRFCAILVGIYETEKIIRTSGTGIDTRIFITQNGMSVYEKLPR